MRSVAVNTEPHEPFESCPVSSCFISNCLSRTRLILSVRERVLRPSVIQAEVVEMEEM